MTTRLIIAGGRDFNNYELLRAKVDRIVANLADVEIVSGRCSTGPALTFVADDGTRVYGADGLGERYAKERGLPVKSFPADWSLGRKAGPIRNQQMAEYATHCVVFWDGRSKGTKSMIDLAGRYSIPLRVVSTESSS